jgi:outer membrane protein assembly factor BamB
MEDTSTQAYGSARAAHRAPWLFLGLMAFLAGAIVWARWYAQYEPGTGNLSTYAAVALMILITAVWVARRRNWPAVIRYAPLAVIIIGGVAFFSYYRLAGWSSSLHPLFEPRWSTRELLPAAAAEPEPINRDAPITPVATTVNDFPGFLGPNHDQTVTAVRLARDWATQKPELIWRHPVGDGWSGFAVVADYAVTQEQREDEEMVVCYDLKTGEIRWAHRDPVRFGSTRSFGGLGPRATPTIHDSRVFTLGATGIFNCLELATGRVLWSKDIRAENGAENVFWGRACSPLVVDDLVVVSAGGEKNNSLVAYRQQDGSRAWSGGSDRSAYSSPQLAALCGIRQIMIVNEDWTAGHDAANGRVLWRFSWPGKSADQGNASQARVVGNDRVFVSKGYTTGAALYQFDAAALKRAQAGGEPVEPQLLWNRQTTKRAVLKTKHSNVCIRDGFAYGLDEDVLQCVELDTGKQRWKRGRYGQGQLLLIDDLILVQAEDGRVALVEANPEEYVELASFQGLEGEPCWNCPALAGPYLLVRNKYEAACYRMPVVKPVD